MAADVVFVVPYVLFYRLILFHFYVRGGFLLDTGLLAGLMWHDGTLLTIPSSVGGGSFFASHVAPVLVLVSAVSYLLPATMPQMFAGFVGMCHGLLALAVFWLLASGYGLRRGWSLLLASVASVAFAFNGLAIAIARYPHFETFGAACLLLCCVALVLEHRAIAVVCFLFAVATREDVGLHAFGFLAVWTAINWWRGVPWRDNAWIAGFALGGLAYSSAALLLQHVAFPGQSSFVRIYLGDPPFSRLGAQMLALRLSGWFWLHPAIILPAIGSILWAARARDFAIVAFHVACLPWAVLHFLAAGELAGWMVGYYGYPFLLAMAWPLLVLSPRRRPWPAAMGSPTAAVAWFLGLIALSLVPVGVHYDPGRIAIPEALLRAPSAGQQARTEHAISAIIMARPALGRLVVDNSVAALRPFAFARAEVATWADDPADTVVYLSDGYDAARLENRTGLPGRYQVAGTQIRIATNRPEAEMRQLGIALDPP